MSATFTRSSTIPNQARNTKHQKQQKTPKAISETEPMYSIVPATRLKSTISSLLLTPFSPTSPTHDHPTTPITKKKNFTSFRGLGCRATSQVSVPAAIRTSADWESKKVKKKKKSKKNKTLNFVGGDSSFSTHNTCCNNPSCLAAPDVWCGPGIGLTTDAPSVDCVGSTRPLSARGRVDVHKITPRERSSCSVRRMVSPEDYPFLDTETLEMPRSRADWFGFRHHRHSHYGFPEGLAEIVMLQNSLMGGRTDGLDRYRSWRLNVDNMSYEELLELSDRIGYVGTGLKEDAITQCVRRTKPFFLNHLSHLRTELEKKCSICQEEYEAEDEMGKLGCGHFYHIHCIKQWLLHKNSCPVCKSAAISDS